MTPRRKDLIAGILFALLIVHAVRSGGGIVAPSGPVHSIFVHETGDDRAEVAALMVQLRNGAAASYFSAAGHRLSVLDDDSQDENGKRVIDEADLQGVALPAMLFYDSAGKLASKEAIPPTATVQTIIEVAGRHGG